jgi:glutamate synthase (NADPH/NADH) small chain
MPDPKGFMKVPRQDAPKRPIEERVADWQEVYPEGGIGRALLPIISEQAGRCMDCGIPFCHSGCPLGNLIPEWNDLVWRGDWEKAIERLHATNNFPEFTGRLCPAPCETACVVAINQDAVTIKNVEVSIIDKAWEMGNVKPQPPEWLTGKTIAVVGSGPAGLAAAQQLTRAGHTVAVYERDDKPGGLMRYGIPEFKMEKTQIDRRIQQMRREGTVFRCNVDVGRDITGEALRERYDAVVLAVGAHRPRELPAPGRDLGGVVLAMDYLPPGNREALGEPVEGAPTAAGKDVVIIGGGDTGADCLGTATRQGARSITQLEHKARPPDERPDEWPWPTYPMVFRTSPAYEEAGERMYAASTIGFDGDDEGNVRALRIAEARRLDDGSWTEVEGTEREIPAQLVLLAMGYTGPERGPLLDQLEVELDDRGWIARNESYATSVPGVFVAGDAGRGQSLIVWAIAEGRAAAAGVDAYLSGSTTLPAPIAPTARPLTV